MFTCCCKSANGEKQEQHSASNEQAVIHSVAELVKVSGLENPPEDGDSDYETDTNSSWYGQDQVSANVDALQTKLFDDQMAMNMVHSGVLTKERIQGAPSFGVRLRKKILLINRCRFPVVIVASSDPTSTFLKAGQLGVSVNGINLGYELTVKPKVSQTVSLGFMEELMLRVQTSVSYLTVLIKNESGNFDIVRINREVKKGSIYCVNNKMTIYPLATVGPNFLVPLI